MEEKVAILFQVFQALWRGVKVVSSAYLQAGDAERLSRPLYDLLHLLYV